MKLDRIKLITIAAFAATAAAVAAVYFYALIFIPLSGASDIPAAKTVFIPKGASFRQIANILVKEGLIKSSKGFDYAASIKGAKKSLQAGEYELSSNMSPYSILSVMAAGKVKRYAVTIPEGFNMYDVAAAVAKTGLFSAEEFLNKATDKKFIETFGIDGKAGAGYSLEGYLYPDTYWFTRTMTVEDAIRKMVGRFNEVFDNDLRRKAKERGYTLKEAVTLASIIEKETGVVSDMPLISAVFTNRLLKGYRLESDPTTIYGIKNFNGNLRKKDLQEKTPYNTYSIFGLPAGPIANPGKQALIAALEPAKESYLYFVSRNDGTHQFSRTLTEHNKAVNTYQKEYFRKKKNSGQ
ncbi:MAG: endolytic transglycosylase MltG [Deltaproteobacteria bacterium]|nr:endolytic transglycosylase MltG [Deltaproteobacteria bacterium]